MQIKEIMTKGVVTVRPDMDLHKLAELFIAKNISGAPVVDDQGKVMGVVREEGLIFQDKKVHLPTFVALSMGFLTLGAHKFEEELKKIAGTKVRDIMEPAAAVLSPDMAVEEVATMMVEKGWYYFPVVEAGNLRGVVTKKDIVRAIAKGKLW